jgi:menaquinone-dependent protoporphyrinogen oxidase
MKTLVVYATKSGCTTGVAERIGEDLTKYGASVDVVSAEKAGDPTDCDAVVVGSGIRAGQWHAAAKSWVDANAEALKRMPVAFYTCCLTMHEEGKQDEARAYTDPIISATGIEPVDIGLFSGWFEAKQFGFAERSILKLMKTPEGDFRDWAAIDEWTDSIAPRIGAGA